MKSLLIIILLGGVMLQSCESASEANTQSDTTKQPTTTFWKLICLGDGITAGVGVAPEFAYPAILQAQLRAEGYSVKIVNAGIKGETVQGANERVEWILQQRLSAVLLALGCEDQKLGHDFKEVSKQWGLLLTKIRKAYPQIPIFITSPCAEDGVFTQIDFYETLSNRFAVTFLPLDLKASPDWWSDDTASLSIRGQAELANQLQKAIEPAIRSGE